MGQSFGPGLQTFASATLQWFSIVLGESRCNPESNTLEGPFLVRSRGSTIVDPELGLLGSAQSRRLA